MPRHAPVCQLLGVWILIATAIPPAMAQVVFDGRIGGPAGAIAPTAPRQPDATITEEFLIDEGRGKVVGGGGALNLFHSFSQFDLLDYQSAVFTKGTSPIDHIIARVTSGSASTVFGQIHSEVPGASLFLLNPHGIIFGSKSRIEVDGGALYLSSADTLTDDAGDVFDVHAETPLLFMGTPTDFGFLGGGAGEGEIELAGYYQTSGAFRPSIGPDPLWDGRFHVTAKSISIADGTIIAPGTGTTTLAGIGSIQLAAVGESAAQLPTELSGFSANATGVGTDAIISIGANHTLRTRDADVNIGGGRIVIRGGELTVDRSDLVHTGGGTGVAAADDGTALPAIDIEVTGTVAFNSGAEWESFSSQRDRNNEVSSVSIRAGRLTLNNAIITNRTFTDATAGGIFITADEIELNNNSVIWSLAGGAAGDAGNIEILTSRLSLDNNALITNQTKTDGSAGGIFITADEINLARNSEINTVATQGAGDAGRILILTSQLSLDNSFLQSHAFASSTGDVGDVVIVADSAELARGSQIGTSTDGAGDAGRIDLRIRDSLTIGGSGFALDGKVVSSGLFARSGLGAGSTATGNAGRIDIRAGTLSLTDGGQISSAVFSASGGDAGEIKVDVEGTLLVEGAPNTLTQITSESVGGDGGAIDIEADAVELRSVGIIVATTTGSGIGGAIDIDARSISISGVDAQGNATTVATGTTVPIDGGPSGRIELHADEDLVISDGAEVLSRSTGDGDAADIVLEAGRDLRILGNALVDSSAMREVPDANDSIGNVFVTAGARLVFHDSSISTFSKRLMSGNVVFSAGEYLDALRANVTTTVDLANATGGDLSIEAPLVVLDQVVFRANAGGPSADAGNIFITASTGLFSSFGNDITANAERGINGEILLDSPENTLLNDLAPLPEALLDVSDELANRCIARTSAAGSFQVLGEVPARRSPDDLLGEPRSQESPRERDCAVP